ncbi:pyridoxal phosphate-dependent aminotransferase [Bradyrhizobium sp. BWA-3-5]|uniref:pyridoxal phosphate-dependent aminotransferase n=1 Tax=Bradyrhizobium sp. BWA-3-5 TaxID=3080013 RepID=UPI00293ECE3F|nr:pyridoxal phosphate-dependent aminotransferase [Bradyrhizobium sp. BWA-3-5]WOH63741.1 pyridoxal phosphate-dependent aminotransferase [Bradyrhizobium sp. BWA-3-5]
MQPYLNTNIASAPPSATFRVMDKVAARIAAGQEVIDLGSGESDFDTPEHVRAAAIAAIEAGHTRYTQVAGLRKLRQAIVEKFNRENGLSVTPDDVIVGNGGKQIIFNALAVTLNKGDEVIIPAPYWVSYPGMVQLCGGKAIEVQCGANTRYKLTSAALEQAITPNTRWLIINSPSNPSGAVYSREELRCLAEVLLRHPNVMVLSDDIYEHLLYDDAAFATIAAVEPRLAARTLTMNGVSKSYAMTGWRIGYGVGPSWLISAMSKLQGQQTSGACTISQHAAIAALAGPQEFVAHCRSVFQQRRDRMVRFINNTPGLSCIAPDGAFYVFASCAGLLGRVSRAGTQLSTDEDVAAALLDEAGVATVHGSAFGLPSHIRFGFSYGDETLARACSSIEKFCHSVR